MAKKQYGLGHTRITVPGRPDLTNKTAVVMVGDKTLEEALEEGGVSDYSDLTNKPSINGVELSGNKTSSDLGVATSQQGAKADTAYQKPQTGIPESDLSSDVQSQLNKHFKGWYNTLAELKAAHTATDGDSAYVKDTSPATTWSIYVYDSTASSDNYWADSGTDADTSNVQTFASSQEVNEVHIVNDLTTGGANDVLSAEQGKEIGKLKDEVDGALSEIDLSNLPIQDGIINKTGNYWLTPSNVGTCVLLPVVAEKRIRITANDDMLTQYAFLQQSSMGTHASTPLYASGYTAIVELSPGLSVDLVVPKDAVTLYLRRNNSSSVNMLPKNVSLISDGLAQQVNSLQNVSKLSGKEVSNGWYINASTMTYQANTNALVYFFCIQSGSVLSIHSNSTSGASIGFLKPFDTNNLYIGKSVEYIEKYPAHITLDASETRDFNVDVDCFLYVFQRGTNLSTDRYPEVIMCNTRIPKFDGVFPTYTETYYSGERPIFKNNPFSRKTIATLPSYAGRTGLHQGMAVNNDYIALFTYTDSPASAKIGLFNLPEQTLIATIDLPHSSYKRPHGNAMTFGKIMHSANSVLPLLYVSQWDADGERGCLVYDITLSGDVYSATLVQAIIPNIDGSIFGNGQADWVVDGDNGYIYSVAYMLSQNGPYMLDDENNPTMVCKFAIPAVSNVVETVLTENDLIDHFAGPSLPYRQGVCVNSGRIWMNRGNANTGYTKYLFASALDTVSKKVVTEIPLQSFGGEPEGIAVYCEKLVMGWSGNAKIYTFDFN